MFSFFHSFQDVFKYFLFQGGIWTVFIVIFLKYKMQLDLFPKVSGKSEHVLVLICQKAAVASGADFLRHCSTFFYKAGQTYVTPTTPTFS